MYDFFPESIRQHTLLNAGAVMGVETAGVKVITSTAAPTTTLKEIAYKAITFATTPSTTTDIPSKPCCLFVSSVINNLPHALFQSNILHHISL